MASPNEKSIRNLHVLDDETHKAVKESLDNAFVVIKKWIPNADIFRAWFEVIADPPAHDEEKQGIIRCDGLNDVELMSVITGLSCSEELKKKIAMQLRGFLGKNTVTDESMKLFNWTSDDGPLNDSQGDASLSDVDKVKEYSRYKQRVYFSRMCYWKISGKHYFVLAHICRSIELPFYSLKALARSNRTVHASTEALLTLAVNQLHKMIGAECPELTRVVKTNNQELLGAHDK
jgi:hypothetical protein